MSGSTTSERSAHTINQADISFDTIKDFSTTTLTELDSTKSFGRAENKISYEESESSSSRQEKDRERNYDYNKFQNQEVYKKLEQSQHDDHNYQFFETTISQDEKKEYNLNFVKNKGEVENDDKLDNYNHDFETTENNNERSENTLNFAMFENQIDKKNTLQEDSNNDKISKSFETTENYNVDTSFVTIDANIERDTTLKNYDQTDQSFKTTENYDEEAKTISNFVALDDNIENSTTLSLETTKSITRFGTLIAKIEKETTSKNYNHALESTKNHNENTENISSFGYLEAKVEKGTTTLKLYDHDQTEKSFETTESYYEETETISNFESQEEKIEKSTTSKNYDNDQINHSFETTENNNENTSFVDLEAKINKDTTIKLYDHDQTEKFFVTTESYNEETKTVQSFVTQEEKIEKGTTLKNYDNDQIDNSFDTTKNNNENTETISGFVNLEDKINKGTTIKLNDHDQTEISFETTANYNEDTNFDYVTPEENIEKDKTVKNYDQDQTDNVFDTNKNYDERTTKNIKRIGQYGETTNLNTLVDYKRNKENGFEDFYMKKNDIESIEHYNETTTNDQSFDKNGEDNVHSTPEYENQININEDIIKKGRSYNKDNLDEVNTEKVITESIENVDYYKKVNILDFERGATKKDETFENDGRIEQQNTYFKQESSKFSKEPAFDQRPEEKVGKVEIKFLDNSEEKNGLFGNSDIKVEKFFEKFKPGTIGISTESVNALTSIQTSTQNMNETTIELTSTTVSEEYTVQPNDLTHLDKISAVTNSEINIAPESAFMATTIPSTTATFHEEVEVNSKLPIEIPENPLYILQIGTEYAEFESKGELIK